MCVSNNDEIMVSVCCLVYNHEKYLRQCLDGFIMQKTDFKFEVLIHDDASTDHSADIIREYEAKYPDIIKPIYQKENQHSQHIPINKTYQYPRAKGKYLAFCEGDDFWCDENKLQMQFDALESHPECAACFTKVQRCNEDGSAEDGIYPSKEIFIPEGIISQKEFSRILCSYKYPFQTSGYFMKKECIDFLHDKTFVRYMNGDESILRCALALGSVYYIDNVMSIYRLFSTGSWSSRNRDRSLNEKINQYTRYYQGNLIFDRESNYVCHDIIVRGINKWYCGFLATLSDRQTILELFDLTDLSYRKAIKYISLKPKIRLTLALYCQPLLKVYEFIKRKVKGVNNDP